MYTLEKYWPEICNRSYDRNYSFFRMIKNYLVHRGSSSNGGDGGGSSNVYYSY